jgi:hypothetical protein
MQSLFDDVEAPGYENYDRDQAEASGDEMTEGSGATSGTIEAPMEPGIEKSSPIRKIVMFYGDNSFEEFYPR